MSAAIVTGALAAAGMYLVLQRGLLRLTIGVLLLQHAVNLLLVTARAPQRDDAPILPVRLPADPLGQAFVLTAIVIGLGSAIFLLALALEDTRRGRDPSTDGGAGGDGDDGGDRR